MKNKAVRKISFFLFLICVFFSCSGVISSASTEGASATKCITAECSAGGEIEFINKDIKVSSRLYELLFKKSTDKEKCAYLIPGGDVFGIRIKEAHVTVTAAKEGSPLKRGDKILSIGKHEILETKDVEAALAESGGGTVNIGILRSGEKMTITIIPKLEDGKYRLGVTLRQISSGIGTVTFIDPETHAFGGLGHGICEAETGKPVDISTGEVTGVVLGGVTRGEIGKPGELSGLLNKKSLGAITKNNECGCFGVLENPDVASREALPVGKKSELHAGEAEIISTVKGGKRQSYKIEITDIDINSTGSKSFKIRVTDPMLITLTGGIVRGMSGSPIIQNGKLVGAVTHVMVANPTEGYGIFIENMLNAAQMPMAKAS